MDTTRTMILYTEEGLELDAILNEGDTTLVMSNDVTFTPAQQLKKFRTYLYIYLIFIPLSFAFTLSLMTGV